MVFYPKKTEILAIFTFLGGLLYSDDFKKHTRRSGTLFYVKINPFQAYSFENFAVKEAKLTLGRRSLRAAVVARPEQLPAVVRGGLRLRGIITDLLGLFVSR